MVIVAVLAYVIFGVLLRAPEAPRTPSVRVYFPKDRVSRPYYDVAMLQVQAAGVTMGKRLGENAERVAYVDVEYTLGSSSHEIRHVTGKPKYDVGDVVHVLVDTEKPTRATVQIQT